MRAVCRWLPLRQLRIGVTTLAGAASACQLRACRVEAAGFVRVPYSEVHAEVRKALERHGVAADDAERCATVIAGTERDGVHSHGVARLPTLLSAIDSGHVKTDVRPRVVASCGSLERWDGQSGIGVINAQDAMGRAIELAKDNGVGIVALRNTGHWLRGGSYGLQAADAGCVGVCWTNTCPVMAPWGGPPGEKRIGNNPFVICVPGAGGAHVILDMACSQYALGRLDMARKAGTKLEVPGGFDADGKLTDDPSQMYEGGDLKSLCYRAAPAGFWKGSGLAVVLDAAAAFLTDGNSTASIDGSVWAAGNVSQVFVAVNPSTLGDSADEKIESLKKDLAGCGSAQYPGQGMLRKRTESMQEGVRVDATQWEQLRNSNR